MQKENKEENRVVYLKVKNKTHTYECMGVYMSEKENKIEIAFNAVNDKVLDSLHFNMEDVVEMRDVRS